MFAVKRLQSLKPGRGTAAYHTISYIRDDGWFRGPAVFETLQEAEAYANLFKDRMRARSDKTRVEKGYKPIESPGIAKIYPTKSNGEEWYMNMSNPTSDPRFNLNNPYKHVD